MTIIVIAGGLSHERDVSLRSGRRVAQALRDVGRLCCGHGDDRLVSHSGVPFRT